MDTARQMAEAFFIFVGVMTVLGGGAFAITAGIKLAQMALKD